jgi:hypothetical protein
MQKGEEYDKHQIEKPDAVSLMGGWGRRRHTRLNTIIMEETGGTVVVSCDS